MRLAQFIFSAVLISTFGTPPAGFAQPDIEAHRAWLISFPTASTVGKGGFEIGFMGRYSSYRFPDPRTEVVDFFLMSHIGLTARLNLSVIAPYSWISGEPNLGMSDLALSLKYRAISGSQSDFAISTMVSLPTGKREAFRGTGRVNYQIDLLTAHRWQRASLYVNAGFGYAAYVIGEATYKPSGRIRGLSGTLTREPIFKFAMGFEIPMSSSFSFVVETLGEVIPGYSDRDLYFQAGGIFQITRFLRLKASSGTGIPIDGSTITTMRAAFGINYLLN